MIGARDRSSVRVLPSTERAFSIATVSQATYDALAGAAAGRLEALESDGFRPGEGPEAPRLDRRSLALVKIGALIALDAPPASYGIQIGNALESGMSAEDAVAVLRAIAPLVGAAKTVAAAPEIMLALGLELPETVG